MEADAVTVDADGADDAVGSEHLPGPHDPMPPHAMGSRARTTG